MEEREFFCGEAPKPGRLSSYTPACLIAVDVRGTFESLLDLSIDVDRMADQLAAEARHGGGNDLKMKQRLKDAGKVSVGYFYVVFEPNRESLGRGADVAFG